MQNFNSLIISHYSKKNLLNYLINRINEEGLSIDSLTLDDLKSFDEFHIGGLQATLDLINQLNIKPNMSVLDIGCGIGGSARQIAFNYNAKVTGIDLTEEFIKTAIKLTELVGLNIRFQKGSALDIPYDNNIFDIVTLIHVGMNIYNKRLLFSEVARVIKKTGKFAIYDIMRIKKGILKYPVPWASNHKTSFVDSPEIYFKLAKEVGFITYKKRIRKNFALEYFKKLKNEQNFQRKRLGLKLLIGADSKIKAENIENAIRENLIAPIEIIFKKK